ncbi:MAG: TrkH family potassium uptake protein [Spirochaetes bacterium]|nr:MAG: TrkH family potassium uptake protein [Spirochaetota bacterium]
MKIKTVLYILSVLMIIVSLFMLLCGFISLLYGENASFLSFLEASGIVLIISIIIFLFTRSRRNQPMGTREGFLVVTFGWIFSSLSGALPFYLSGEIPSYTDAFFETMSGFTTTGASILTDIEALSHGMLFWRSLTHWLGGMGIVVLTVALLPIFGVGGLKLLRAEAPGPTVDKMTPKIKETAKILWFIYFSFTILETILLIIGGMSLFDALTHTFGTLATGGFSTRSASVGAYSSPFIHVVITVFMVLSGMNFNLYYKLISGRIREFFKDTEMKVYLAVFSIATVLIAVNLIRVYHTFSTSLRYAGFQAASILTTTGYATADFSLWPAFSRNILFFLMFVGGSAGSTGGGMKVIRLTALMKMGINEMKYLVTPKGVFPVRINGQVVKKDILYPIAGFVLLYITVLLAVTITVASGGYGILTSFTTSLATLGNIGPGFGKIGPALNYSFYPVYIKWVLSAAMMLGRLELYTVLILLTPHFWRH